MYKKVKIISSLLSFLLMFSVFSACKEKNTSEKTVITFWIYGNEEEVQVFSRLVENFNKSHADLSVKMEQKPDDGYVSLMEQVFSGTRGPDVFYVADGQAKKWITLGFLSPIDDYVKNSSIIDTTDIWPSALKRYTFDPQTTLSTGENAYLYALPKDIGPTVLYYNKEFFTDVGVNTVSVDESQIDDYNTKNSSK